MTVTICLAFFSGVELISDHSLPIGYHNADDWRTVLFLRQVLALAILTRNTRVCSFSASMTSVELLLYRHVRCLERRLANFVYNNFKLTMNIRLCDWETVRYEGISPSLTLSIRDHVHGGVWIPHVWPASV